VSAAPTQLWAVRWKRPDRDEIRTRYYLRRHAALALAERLEVYGLAEVRVFTSATEWKRVPR
jgi:hypothetical protein